jgi:hypothetical protein
MSQAATERPAARLARLSPEHQEALLTHCDANTITRAATWVREQFNIDISPTSLGGWLRKQRANRSVFGPTRKARPDRKLASLCLQEQQAIFIHCRELSLNEGVAWIKAQYGIQLSQSALASRLRKHREDDVIGARLEAIRDDSERALLVGNIVGAAATISEANTYLFAQAIFEEFRKPQEQRDERRLVNYMNAALKARSVHLAYERHQFDAAKQAMKCLTKLQEIQAGGGDEQQKIEQAVKVLFGERPENTTFQSEAA